MALTPLLIPRLPLLTGDQESMTANGGTDPFPIPWLDKNGSHNQPAGPNLEPSHIYHFKGRVARCSTFTGIGTDNQGNQIALAKRPRVLAVNRVRFARGRARNRKWCAVEHRALEWASHSLQREFE